MTETTVCGDCGDELTVICTSAEGTTNHSGTVTAGTAVYVHKDDRTPACHSRAMAEARKRRQTETTASLDFSAHYTVKGSPGVAWRLLGYAREMTEESWTKNCDDPAHVFDYDVNDYEDGDYDTHGPDCYLYNEPEEVDNTSMVRAVMVGDDRPEIIDVDDLELLPESGYCRDCGQTRCTSNVYE